ASALSPQPSNHRLIAVAGALRYPLGRGGARIIAMLFEAFRSRAAALPSSSGLRFRGECHPYASLAERAECAAGALVSRGVDPGSRVALLLPNSPDLFAAVQACFAIGAIAVPVSALASPRELAWIAANCRIDAVVAPPT